MKIIATSVWVLMFSLQALSQHKFNVLVGTGIGFYKQGDLKDWQSSIEPYVGLETVNDFPPYFFFTAEISRELVDRFSVGLVYRLESTGYKSSYADYSGSIQFQQVLKMNGMGFLLRYDMLKQNKFTVAAQLRTYYTKSTVELESKLFLEPSSQREEYLKYESRSWMLSPGIDLSYALTDQVLIHATIEYSLDFKGKLELESSHYYMHPMFYDYPNDEKTDWSGVRLGFGVAFRF